MNPLTEILSSPLLDFMSSNLSSNNTEWPKELEILLETLSEVMFGNSIEKLQMT